MGVDIGGKVKSIRQSKAITQSELAKRSGVAQSTLSYIEKGAKHPRFNTLSAICKGLGVSVFELLSYGEKASRTKLFEAQLNAISQGQTVGDTQSSYDLEKYLYEKLIQLDDNSE
ncbi:MAG: helix-turn-helix transcriptional regulator [Clostridia bacterium]|jgi:transcriptional regulator with XRE-family HTH domain|nr:helix-turn-helix transcriptional regulator [Clostridia bacterium]